MSLYNPRDQQDDDAFVETFVARHALTDTLLRRLHAIGEDEAGSHQVLIGARGMGKTSLLRRIAIGITRDPDLAARFIPLTFREEQYNVNTLGDFWRNCGESLAEWAETSGNVGLARKLDTALTTSAWAGDDAPTDAFQESLVALGRRAVLLVDNLDLILDALPSQSDWALRRSLQMRRGPILIGATTQALKQSADRDAAFYQFFDPVFLEPLDVHETEQCLRALAGRGGEEGARVLQILNSQPARLRTLHGLTGGNPRVLSLIFRILGTGDSADAFADLERLLDEVTPFYKAKVEEYQTPQQRKVIDAIALAWDPVTTGELGDLTKIATTTLSPLLSRLRKDGLIETVEVSGAYAGHQIVERFLNIWYLMRHGSRRAKQKMRWFVAFLTTFFPEDDLIRPEWDASMRKWGQDYQTAFRETRAAIFAKSETRSATPSGATLSDEGSADNRVDESRKLFQEAFTRGEMGEPAAAIAIYDEVVARFGDAPEAGIRELVVEALFNKGVELGLMGQSAAAIDSYDKIVARFGGAPEADIRELVAKAPVNKGYELGRRGEKAAAIETYDEVVARFGGAPDAGIREQVAKALVNKGLTLGEMGEREAEIAIYDKIVARFGDAPEAGIKELVATALVNQGITLGEIGERAAEIAIYDDVVARFGGAPEAKTRELVAMALFFKGVRLSEMGESAAAIAICDEVVAHLRDASEAVLREWLARALVLKGGELAQMGESAAAIATFDEVVARFGDASEAGLREQVAWAVALKGYALAEMGESAASIAIFEEVVARFPDFSLRSRAELHLANLLLDIEGDIFRTEQLYLSAMAEWPLEATENLAWLYLFANRTPEAIGLRDASTELPPKSLNLLNAGIDLASDNFGTASQRLYAALDGDAEGQASGFGAPLERLLRLAHEKGYGDRLIGWFEETGFADRLAPIYVALKAYFRGERLLLDVNPEVRAPAQAIYDRLVASRRFAESGPRPTST